jgi:hypothetical protein
MVRTPLVGVVEHPLQCPHWHSDQSADSNGGKVATFGGLIAGTTRQAKISAASLNYGNSFLSLSRHISRLLGPNPACSEAKMIH